MQAAGLASAIDDRGPYTVLAPTNAAFARLPASQLTALLANKSALTTVLQRHVIADRILVNEPTFITHLNGILRIEMVNYKNCQDNVLHGLINYIDTKAKCRHRKKLTCKATLRQVLSEFIGRSYSQLCWFFRLNSVNCCPSNLLSGLISPLPLSLCELVYSILIYSL